MASYVGIAQAPTFRTTTRLVPIYATVRGANGSLLTDLDRDAFEVFEDGRLQAIAAFSSDPAPIIGIALWDVSPSMATSMDRLRLAADSFVAALWPEDRIRIGTFSEEISFSPNLTHDKSILRRIIAEEFWPGYRGSPVWSALGRGISLLARESGRRVLLILSDGETAEQTSTRDDVAKQLQEIDCLVYAISLEGHGFSRGLRDIAELTGGGSKNLATKASLRDEFEAIVAELHHQYLIGFAPGVLDGRLHSLRVQVNVPGATVRARKAYIASSR